MSELTSTLGVLQLDPWLSPFQDSLKRRYAKAQEWIQKINQLEGGLEKFSRVRLQHHTHFAPGEILVLIDVRGSRVPKSLA